MDNQKELGYIHQLNYGLWWSTLKRVEKQGNVMFSPTKRDTIEINLVVCALILIKAMLYISMVSIFFSLSTM